MIAHPTHSPLNTAAQIQGMAGKAGDERVAKILTSLSVAVLLMMLVREGREMFAADHHRPAAQSWREREDERRAEPRQPRPR